MELPLTCSELEWTIIFGLNCTKIYGGHMSFTDFCGGYVCSIDFLCLEQVLCLEQI